MFEDTIGRVVSGALWGAGAAAAMSLVRRRGDGLRPVAKTVVKGYLDVADRLSEITAEARETLGDIYAEARAERSEHGEKTTPSAAVAASED
jgi:hypothetical protein